MQRFNRVLLLTAALALPALAAGPVIGLVVAEGQIVVDQATVAGNGNLNAGSVVKTHSTAARLKLTGGVRAVLGPRTRAQIHADRLELADGLGIVTASPYRVVAGNFAVEATQGAQSQVFRQGDRVEIAAVNGPVLVRDRSGMPIARVLPDRALRLTPGTPGVSTMTGTLRQEQNHFRLLDEISNLDVELRGADLQPQVGRRIEISGQASALGDSQLIQVARLNPSPQPPSTGAAKPTGAARPTAPGKSKSRRTETPPPPKTAGSKPSGGGGMSSGAVIGIIAAAGGGVGAALALSGGGSDSPSAPISR